MSKIKVAVIGHGHLGKWHAQKVESISDSELVAIVDPSIEGQKELKSQYPKAILATKVEDIIDQIDAAIVVTPTSTHFELVKMLLENDKHVFCEKPLCSNLEQAKIIRDLVEQKKQLVAQVGHSERFHIAWKMIEEFSIVKDEKNIIAINRYAPFKGRATDVDVVQDLMIHDIDLLLYLFSATPKKVFAKGLKIRTDHWDHVVAQFTYDSGRIATITSGRNSTQEVRSLEVLSENGALTVDMFQNKIFHAPNTKFEDGSFVSEENYQKRDHLLLEQQEFYQSILNKKHPVVSVQEGLDAIAIIEAVIKSIEQGKEVLL